MSPAPCCLNAEGTRRRAHHVGCHQELASSGLAERVVLGPEVRMGIKQVAYRDWISARQPNGNEQAFCQVLHDIMFEIFRIGPGETRKPTRVRGTASRRPEPVHRQRGELSWTHVLLATESRTQNE